MLLSASRDKTLIIWNLTRDETQYGYPKRSLHGHSHIVSDCVRLPAVFRGCLLLESRGEGNWNWNWNRCADWRGR